MAAHSAAPAPGLLVAARLTRLPTRSDREVIVVLDDLIKRHQKLRAQALEQLLGAPDQAPRPSEHELIGVLDYRLERYQACMPEQALRRLRA